VRMMHSCEGDEDEVQTTNPVLRHTKVVASEEKINK
jgi:hypothetical protein